MDLIPIRILSASNKTKPKRDPKFIALAQFVVYLKSVFNCTLDFFVAKASFSGRPWIVCIS